VHLPSKVLTPPTCPWHQWQQAQALLSQAEQIAQSTLELRQCIDRQVDAARCVAANLVHYYSALVHAVAVFQVGLI